MTTPTGLTVTGSPINTNGTLAVTMTAGYAIPTTASQTNWDTAFSERQQWSGTSTNLVASTGRSSLGGTTVGQNLFTLTNPSAITFVRVNADNTVSMLDAATYRTAIGAGTGNGSVTSMTVSAGTGMSGGGTVTTSGTVTLTNAGVTSLAAGTGISVSASTGGVTVTNSGVTSVNGSTGAVTIASGAQAFIAFGSTGGF
jgi:hypothetical protein